jgi:hypothetical protein
MRATTAMFSFPIRDTNGSASCFTVTRLVMPGFRTAATREALPLRVVRRLPARHAAKSHARRRWLVYIQTSGALEALLYETALYWLEKDDEHVKNCITRLPSTTQMS